MVALVGEAFYAGMVRPSRRAWPDGGAASGVLVVEPDAADASVQASAGYQSGWTDPMDQHRRAILDAACNRRMANYNAVAHQVTAAQVDPFSAMMNRLLGAVCKGEHETGRPMFTGIIRTTIGTKTRGWGYTTWPEPSGIGLQYRTSSGPTHVQDVFKLHGRHERGENATL